MSIPPFSGMRWICSPFSSPWGLIGQLLLTSLNTWIRNQLIVYNMGAKKMNNLRSGKKTVRRALFLLTGAL